ncbi:MAG: TRAP transporter small permease [Rubrivivax sp.]
MLLLQRLNAVLARVLAALLIVAVGVLVLPVSLQIFSRYTSFIPSYIWTEEMARFCLVWLVMIGAMIGVRDGVHFDVDVWPRLSPRADAVLTVVSSLAILVFALAFLWWGIEFTRFAWRRISELAELPLWLIHVAWPITGAAWLLFQGERLARAIQVLRAKAPA